MEVEKASRMLTRIAAAACLLAFAAPAAAQSPSSDTNVLIVPARVFDAPRGITHDGWAVLARGTNIVAVGPRSGLAVPPNTREVSPPITTLLPGLIEGLSHLFLHPYIETPWADQVLKEPLALRMAQATVAARLTLQAGFTTERDLGTEDASDSDVGLEAAINQGIIPGPRLIVVTRAIVATGTYGPSGFDP